MTYGDDDENSRSTFVKIPTGGVVMGYDGECETDPRDARISQLEEQLREREEECPRADMDCPLSEKYDEEIRILHDKLSSALKMRDTFETRLRAAQSANASAEQALAAARSMAHVADVALSLGLVANARESLRLITCGNLAALKSRSDDAGRVERVAAVMREYEMKIPAKFKGLTWEVIARAVLTAADREGE